MKTAFAIIGLAAGLGAVAAHDFITQKALRREREARVDATKLARIEGKAEGLTRCMSIEATRIYLQATRDIPFDANFKKPLSDY